jgi:hypothetical protein
VSDSRVLRVYALVVLLNYAAQVPYALHLYGLAFSRSGLGLLLATLAWFGIAWLLCRQDRPIGIGLLLAYALAQVVFYLNSEVVQTFRGFGLPYHLLRTTDPILWWTFLIGDFNFVAACAASVVLIRDLWRWRRVERSAR